MVFALFNVVWATLFLERWKRRGAELAYKWGTLDAPAESLEEPRPQFRVRKIKSALQRQIKTIQQSDTEQSCATGKVIADEKQEDRFKAEHEATNSPTCKEAE